MNYDEASKLTMRAIEAGKASSQKTINEVSYAFICGQLESVLIEVLVTLPRAEPIVRAFVDRHLPQKEAA